MAVPAEWPSDVAAVDTPYRREPGYAERYRDQRFQAGHGPATDRRERQALQGLLQLAGPAPGRWLDVPAGTGRLSLALPGAAVLVDRDPAMLRACPPQLVRVCAAAAALPFADGSFAGALCMRLLQHIPHAGERVRILAELRRTSRGPVIVSFFDACSLQHLRRCLRRATGKPRSGRSAIRRRTFAAEARAAGFELRALRPLRRFVAEQTLALLLPAIVPER